MQEMLHRLLLVAGHWEVIVIQHVWVLPRVFGIGNGRGRGGVRGEGVARE